MFDEVIHKTRCWRCGELIKKFQTKDGPRRLETVNVRNVRRFYNRCTRCNAWNEFQVVVKSYEVVFDKNESERMTKPLPEADREKLIRFGKPRRQERKD